MGPKYTTKQFIQKARIIHGWKYNYNRTIYLNAHSKVIITCPLHGEFEQIPNDHLSSHGCRKCGNLIIKDSKNSNLEQFIEKSKAIHGNKYDYTKVEYTYSRKKVCIICPIHGEFEQTPFAHIQGQGCSFCANIKLSNIKKLTLDQFIKRAIAIHGNKYDYNKVNYTDTRTKINILCLKHGQFEQTPGNHVYNNAGCPKCKASKGELVLETIFKKHSILHEPQYNIPEITANYEIDFYLPDYRCLVEFHGIQHYEYIPFFHDGEYTFEDQKDRDNMVRDAAIRWKYGYLEFNYKQLKHMSQEQFEQLVINKINKFSEL